MKNELLKPIFIGGTGRCGTTILKKVIQQHSKIVALPSELRIIIDPDGILDLTRALTELWSTNRADAAIVRFRNLISKSCKGNLINRMARRLERKSFWPLTIQGYYGIISFFGDDYVRSRTEILMQELIYHQTNGTFIHTPPFTLKSRATTYESGPFDKDELFRIIQNYVNDLYSSVAQKNTTCWLDDTPLNILHAIELAKLFKNMKLIHIYRDPRDVVSSYFSKIWGGDQLEMTARRVAGIYRQWQQVKTGLSSEQFIEISLEELSARPKSTLHRICDHIGLDFEEGLLDIKLDKTNSGRWKKDIPSTELETVLGQLDPFLSVYGR